MRSKPIGERKPNGDGRTAEQKLYEAALEAESRTAEAQAGSLILEMLKADIGSLPATNPYREDALKAFSVADLGSRPNASIPSVTASGANSPKALCQCRNAVAGRGQYTHWRK